MPTLPRVWLSASRAGDFIHHGHQARTYAGFHRRETGGVDDDEFRTGPRAVQLSGCYRGARQIVTTLHNGRRQVANSVYAVEQLILGLVSIVSKVMDFDACHCVRDPLVIRLGNSRSARNQVGQGRLENTPAAGSRGSAVGRMFDDINSGIL